MMRELMDLAVRLGDGNPAVTDLWVSFLEGAVASAERRMPPGAEEWQAAGRPKTWDAWTRYEDRPDECETLADVSQWERDLALTDGWWSELPQSERNWLYLKFRGGDVLPRAHRGGRFSPR